jgi:hypothetical protein
MNGKPAFFEPIRQQASKRWDQLEHDPELAGSWHQLFKQVQSPRHILSELLQNADDAGATEASVLIENRSFIFTHNGEDFAEEHFASLYRFGYSNKRALHTIGFRGIGFKSTFSLGDTVELYTPTLSVSFNRRRFTEPKWLAPSGDHAGRTRIRVAISDDHRQREVEKNLQEWLKSPVSLLFFKHIRRLQIGDKQVHWGSLGPGPIPETEWMALQEDPEQSFLVARSGAEPFPTDALNEIRQERMLGDNQDSDFPPCKVEIVLGAKGRLYVVLPTGVETALPFACNAPFIQDPARLKIKDPETSPTNRWLLERIGTLAASVMLQWLEQTSQSLTERSCAYGFFPDVDRDDNSLEGTCAAIVEETFDAAIEEKAFLLTNHGELKPSGQSVVIPEELFDVWPAEQVTALLDGANRPAFSRKVSRTDIEKLGNWGVVEKIGKDEVLSILETSHLPKPEAWRSLLKLWAYVAPEITGYKHHLSEENIRIFPVQGKDVLYSASEVVRLGEKKLLKTNADWDFLAAHLLVLNQNWPRFLAEQRREATERKDKNVQVNVDAAYAIFDSVNLEEASDVSTVIEQVAMDYFSGKESILLSGCIQLAQIASKLGATVDESFRFATKDRNLHEVSHAVIFDVDGTLESIFSEKWSLEHLLHPDYSKSFDSCTSEEWLGWVASGRSGLHTFAPLAQVQAKFWGRPKAEAELSKRGFTGTSYYPYSPSNFQLEDWDFEAVHWLHWITLAKEDDSLWGRLVSRILAQPEAYWSKAKSARIFQIATTGSKRAITNELLVPTWILKLRDLPCLSDTRGFYRKPADLLRRTPETESLMDVELFIHGRLDTEATRPLLKLLGVRDMPTGPDRLLDCLRALAKASNPPAHEVEKWYRRLDQMIDTCSTNDFANIKKALREEKIVLTEDSSWSNGSGVFLSSDEEDVPGAAVIRASCRDLALWRKIGIADRPTADLVIQWLKELPSGKELSQEDSRRVHNLLKRHAVRIWDECGHWVNLSGEWAPVETLEYALSMQTLVPWVHLHGWVKKKTADFQRLPTEITEVSPFSNLPHLGGQIEERFHRNLLFPGQPERKSWLNQLGVELRRIVLDDEADTERIRALAADLSETTWQIVPGLELVPYIDGTPAGTPRRADVVWLDKVLYVDQLPNAKLARIVPDRLGKIFGRTDIAAAMNYCFGRSPVEITEYIEENFKLAPRNAFVMGQIEGAPLVGESSAADTGTVQPPSTEQIPKNAGTAAVIKEDNAESESEVESEKNAEEDEIELDSDEVTPPKEPIHPKPAKPRIIERFARKQGFQEDGDDRFYHVDGSWIAKTHGDSFPWERRTATGEIVCYYWPKEHCLEMEPLQLDADVWGLIDKFPETYALVLSNSEGEPIEVSGSNLRAMRDEAKLTLYPATYRLVFDHDHK